MPITSLQAGRRGKYSKHNILCGTVHEYHEKKKQFLQWTPV